MRGAVPPPARSPASHQGTLLRNVGSMSVATGVSRVLGLARDQAQAYVFGASAATDAFFAAFRIGNLFRDLFAEGALSAAFVPTFTAAREREGAEAAWTLARRVMSALVLILGVLALVMLVAAPWVVQVFAPGFGPEKAALTTVMTRILSPFLLFVALAAVAMGVLNTCGRFFLPAVAPAWFNVAAIVAVLALPPALAAIGWHPALSLAIGASVGGLLQFLVQVPALRQEGFRPGWDLSFADPRVRRIGVLMLPAIFGLAATQINILVDTVLASNLGDGPIAWLAFAFRLMQLPIGLFGVAIATANLTRVSRDAARQDVGAMRAGLAGALRAAALLTLPATAGLIALREPIVRVLFEHGRFGPEDTVATGGAVLCYALGLYAYSVVKIQVPTYYALGDTRRPVIASATAIALKIPANFALLALLPTFGIRAFLGLALATSLASWANLLVLAHGLHRRLGSMREHAVVRQTLVMALGSVVVGLAAGLSHAGLERAVPGGGFAGDVLRLGVATAVGLLTTVAAVVVARIPEGQALLARLARRRVPR